MAVDAALAIDGGQLMLLIGIFFRLGSVRSRLDALEREVFDDA